MANSRSSDPRLQYGLNRFDLPVLLANMGDGQQILVFRRFMSDPEQARERLAGLASYFLRFWHTDSPLRRDDSR